MKFNALQKLNITVFIFVFCTLLLPITTFATPSTLVIDEFRTNGMESEKDEYVVISNYGLKSEDMTDFALTIKTGNTNYQYLYRFLAGTYIEAGEKVKICHPNVVSVTDCTYYYSISATSSYQMKSSGVLALIKVINTNNKLNIDVVGYGEMPYEEDECWSTGCELFPLESPERNLLYRRINGRDTDNSLVDFGSYLPPLILDINVNKIVISELLPNPDGGIEWFEIYNPTNLYISLKNLQMCDALGATRCYYFNKNDSLAPGEYKTYSQNLTKITLNNNGDWLELYDFADNFLSDSGGNYGSAEKGISLALFGNEYQWTKTITPNEQNIYTDIIEIEEVTKKAVKTSKSRVKTPKLVDSEISEENGEPEVLTEVDQADVKSAKVEESSEKLFIGRKALGWGLIGLAILLLVGYICWYFRDYAKNIYDKIRQRDDSARF